MSGELNCPLKEFLISWIRVRKFWRSSGRLPVGGGGGPWRDAPMNSSPDMEVNAVQGHSSIKTPFRTKILGFSTKPHSQLNFFFLTFSSGNTAQYLPSVLRGDQSDSDPYGYQCVHTAWPLRYSEKECLAPSSKLQASWQSQLILGKRILWGPLMGSCLHSCKELHVEV